MYRTIVTAPIAGSLISMVDNPAQFAAKAFGNSFIILPQEDLLIAPMDGIVHRVPGSDHAVVLQTQEVQATLQVGVDTAQMQNRGFQPLVRDGEQVSQGQPLLKFDLHDLCSSLPSPAVSMFFSGEIHALRTNGPVSAGDPVASIDGDQQDT